MRCNMCDRYVPISSSAQWERAIGRATRSALPCVARTFSFEETTRAGAAGTLQEARGARGRGSGAHTRRQSSDWLDHEHERACVDARLLLLLCLPLISLARSSCGDRCAPATSRSPAAVSCERVQAAVRDARPAARRQGSGGFFAFDALGGDRTPRSHAIGWPTAMQRNIGVRAGIFLGELRVAGWLCCCFVPALSLLHLIASHVPSPPPLLYHHVEGDRSPRARRCGSRPVGPMPSWPVLVERHDSLLPVLPGLVLVGVRLDLVRSLRCWYVNGGGAAGGGGGVRSASWVAVGGCVPARTGARRESNA